MSALIEDIFYGSEQFTEQPEAIFVWLSDSPQLNEQSKQKIELKADKIRMDQCVVISDESFDREILEDGHIYFLNTQKLGKAGNLSRHSDTRQYTIWETIENTAREKADRLYFIIDEAHRGMQGRQAGTATTIMQRFIKGSSEQNLLPIPVVIGMSATAERFNSLVGQATNSTLHKVIISPAQVRQSGLLKDRIVITYPEDPIKHGDMAVLQAATDEWQDKCKHWYQYTYEQHYTNVNPVFVIQVCAGSGTKVSDTDLDDVIAKIEERMGDSFKENEVVHTFGSTGTLSIHGLTVPHIEPSEIAEDRRIRVVLFKENLSTGWDCPRAETMMSFRRAEDATYIAQLLGRMVRTPLQCHVLVDDSLNDVRLFLPYFNQDTVQKVIDELQATEGGEIPTVVDGESLEEQNYDTWSVHNQRKKTQKLTVGQLSIFDYPNGFQEEPAVAPSTAVGDMPNSGVVAVNQGRVDSELPAEGQHQTIPLETVPRNDVHAGQEIERTSEGDQSEKKEQPVLTPAVSQMSMLPTIDREGITKFINEQGYLTYIVRAVKINSYLKSLMSLAGLLSQFNICITAAEDVKNDVAELIRNYVNGLEDADYTAISREDYLKELERLDIEVGKKNNLGEIKSFVLLQVLSVMLGEQIYVFCSDDRNARNGATNFEDVRCISLVSVFSRLKEEANWTFEDAEPYIESLIAFYQDHHQTTFRVMEASEVRRLQRIPCRQVLQEIFNGKFIELKNGMLRYKR